MYKDESFFKKIEEHIFLSFQAEKEINGNIIKDLRKLFKLKKENEAIKDVLNLFLLDIKLA